MSNFLITVQSLTFFLFPN